MNNNLDKRLDASDGSSVKEFALHMMELIKDSRATRESVRNALNLLIEQDFVPDDLKGAIEGVREDFVHDLTGLVLDLATGPEFRNKTEEELGNVFVRRFLALLLKYHSSGLIMGLDRRYFPELEREKRSGDIALGENLLPTSVPVAGRLQWTGARVFLIVSGATSFAGGKNFSGDIFDKYMKGEVDPETQVYLNYFVGGLSAFIVSFIALGKFKKMLEEKYFFSGGESLADLNYKQKGWAFCMSLLMGLCLTYDVVSNANGVVTETAGNADKMKQLRGIQDEIQRGIGQMEVYAQNVPGSLQKSGRSEVQKMLEAEASGTSASGKSGRGSMYYATLLGMDDSGDSEARGYFADGSTRGGSSKVKEFTWSLIKNDEVLTDDFKGLSDEVKTVSQGNVNVVLEKLSKAKVKTADLSFQDETEITNKKLKEIESLMVEAKDVLNKKNHNDITNVLAKYENFLKKLSQVPRKFPDVYPNRKDRPVLIKRGKVDLPSIKFEVEDMSYKTVEDLIFEYVESGKRLEAALILLMSLFFAILASHGDAVFYPHIGRKTKEDKEKVLEKDEMIYDPIKEGLVQLVGSLLNDYYADELYGGDLRIPEGYIRQVIEEYIDEKVNFYISQTTKWERFKKIVRERFDSMSTLFGKLGYESVTDTIWREIGETHFVTEFNRRLIVLLSLISDSNEVKNIIEAILPDYKAEHIDESASLTKKNSAVEVRKIGNYYLSELLPVLVAGENLNIEESIVVAIKYYLSLEVDLDELSRKALVILRNRIKSDIEFIEAGLAKDGFDQDNIGIAKSKLGVLVSVLETVEQRLTFVELDIERGGKDFTRANVLRQSRKSYELFVGNYNKLKQYYEGVNTLDVKAINLFLNMLGIDPVVTGDDGKYVLPDMNFLDDQFNQAVVYLDKWEKDGFESEGDLDSTKSNLRQRLKSVLSRKPQDSDQVSSKKIKDDISDMYVKIKGRLNNINNN